MFKFLTLGCYILETSIIASHFENMPVQYTEIFKVVKNEYFQQKFFDISWAQRERVVTTFFGENHFFAWFVIFFMYTSTVKII